MDLSSLTKNQRAAVQHLDGPLLICAGAGSGKTFTLTQRIAYAFSPESGPYLNSIDEALVITFTNKAAGELKDRIRSTLRAIGRPEEALRVDDAWISTIHGACNRILHEHALELGLDPGFALALGVEAEEALAAATADVVGRHRAEGAGAFEALFAEFEAPTLRDMVQRIITQASYQTAGLAAFTFGPAAPGALMLAHSLLDECEAALEVSTPKACEAISALATRVEELLNTDTADYESLEALLDSSTFKLSSLGNKAPDLKATVKYVRSAAACATRAPLLAELMELAAQVDAEYRARLAAAGLMDTADLIRTTLAAFDAHPALAAQYTQRFRLIMVDEFQDTSQLQIDMIERIAGPARAHLCTVGDSQQSIYRFQGADVAVYLKHKADMEHTQPKPALREELDQNYRSHGDVLAFVRRICGQPGYFSEAFLDLQAATVGRPWHAPTPRVEVALTEYAYRGATSAQATAAEATFIASRFAELAAAGHSPAEMVLLMGATTGAEVYAQAIRDAGLACVVAGGSKFYSTPQVQAALALLGAIANPYDSERLFSVLTGPALPVSPDDLLLASTWTNPETNLPTRQNLGYALLSKSRAPQAPSPHFQHAAGVLQRAWQRLATLPPSEILMHAIIESGWLARMEDGGPQGVAEAADVLKFVRLVHEAESEGLGAEQAFAHMELAASAAAEKPGALSTDTLNAVRIMTVHASKGLEFPIVAIVNCYKSSSVSSAPAMTSEDGRVYTALLPAGFTADGADYSPGACLRATTQVDFGASIKQTNRQREYEEKKRLFYVAATRASAGLIVGIKHQRTKDNNFDCNVTGDILQGLFGSQDAFPEDDCTLDYGGSEPLRFTRVEIPDESAEEVAEPPTTPDMLFIPHKEDVPALVPHVVPVRMREGFYSYSSLAEHTTPAAPPTAEDSAHISAEDDAAQAADERAHSIADADKATSFGSALHLACEWLAWQPAHTPASAVPVQRFATQWDVHDIDRLHRALCCWACHPVRAQAETFTHRQPEAPFAVTVADKVLEGEIDLLCWDNPEGAAFIVDYKTGGHAEETPNALQAKHLAQAQCYAYATLLSGFTEVDLHFVRVEHNQSVPYHFSQEDLPTLQAIIQARIDSAELHTP